MENLPRIPVVRHPHMHDRSQHPCNLNGGPMKTILLLREVEVMKERNTVAGILTRILEQGLSC